MKPAMQTAEFWTTLATNVVGLVVLFGGITTEQSTEVVSAVTQIVGAVLMLATSFGFIKSRAALRSELGTAAIYAAYQSSVSMASVGTDGGTRPSIKQLLKDAGV